MAFPITDNYGFGTGKKGDLTAAASQTINSYAQVTNVNGKILTIGNISSAEDFDAGNEILLHFSAYKGSASTWNARGKWFVAKIVSIQGDEMTLDKNIGTLDASTDYFVQIVSIPNYRNVTINSGKSLTCPQFDSSKGYGGILAFKCSGTLKFNGGHIDLGTKGLPDATLFEKGTIADEPYNSILRKSAGHENHNALSNLTINYPGAACFVMAKNFSGHKDSRIGDSRVPGNPRSQFCASGFKTYNHVGGSSILICAEKMENFDPKMIAKYGVETNAGEGRGYGRCYIATETILPTDEGLYAYDRISDPSRLSRVFNIKSFGDGSDGEKSNYTSQLNNYAQVSAIDSSRKVFTIANKTTTGFAKFKEGALVMIHASQNKDVEFAGRFVLAKIVGMNLNQITVDTAFDKNISVANYFVQLVTVPQFSTFTLSKVNNTTPKFENGRGGICALAVSGTCNLSGGALNVEYKGGGVAYGEKGLDYIGNAQMAEKLPLGEGHGSVFVLANNLTMNTSTRIGASYTGDEFGGIAAPPKNSRDQETRNYPCQRFAGGDYNVNAYDGFADDTESNRTHHGTTGGGKQAGTCDEKYNVPHNGGYGSNSTDGACQGAHVLIVADKITGFNIAALSTGGQGGNFYGGEVTLNNYMPGKSGGCGYGGSGFSIGFRAGAGGYIGGGGGSSSSTSSNWGSGGGSGAFAFVYCNS